ncbi:MAG TPA: hypothetical protein VM513_33485 [Kofleriaceae bacterium]|nr:hypothetical protein [Kofleriaceae bacterium]
MTSTVQNAGVSQHRADADAVAAPSTSTGRPSAPVSLRLVTSTVQTAGAITADGLVTGDRALEALEVAAHKALKNASRSSQR